MKLSVCCRGDRTVIDPCKEGVKSRPQDVVAGLACKPNRLSKSPIIFHLASAAFPELLRRFSSSIRQEIRSDIDRIPAGFPQPFRGHSGVRKGRFPRFGGSGFAQVPVGKSTGFTAGSSGSFRVLPRGSGRLRKRGEFTSRRRYPQVGLWRFARDPGFSCPSVAAPLGPSPLAPLPGT